MLLLTTGGEDDWSLCRAHERLDGSKKAGIFVENNIRFFKQDERGGRPLALLLVLLSRGRHG